MVLNSTSDVTIVGNLFSGLRPKALTVEGKTSRRVIFADNVLTDAVGEQQELEASVVKNNLEPIK